MQGSGCRGVGAGEYQLLLSFMHHSTYSSKFHLFQYLPPHPPQVYVRRSYTAYDVTCVQHEELEGGMPVVQWQFLLPLSHPNRCGC